MNNENMFTLLIYLCVSFLSSFSIELNHYAKDSVKGKKTIPIFYVSECLIAGLSGFFLAIISMIFVNNGLIHILSAGIGGLAGRKLLFFVVKIGILMFSISKNIDVSKLQDIEKHLKK